MSRLEQSRLRAKRAWKDEDLFPLTVRLERSEEGGIVIDVKELPGCISQGDTINEALTNIQEAITGYLAVLADDMRQARLTWLNNLMMMIQGMTEIEQECWAVLLEKFLEQIDTLEDERWRTLFADPRSKRALDILAKEAIEEVERTHA